MSTYKKIIHFGSKKTGNIDVENSQINDPLTYCIGDNTDQRFLHGGHSDKYGQHSKHCQLYLQNKCASNWDDVCEFASKDNTVSYPNNVTFGGCEKTNDKMNSTVLGGVKAGDILVHNTAKEKYVTETRNCVLTSEPFDPLVASSPLIHFWDSPNCGKTCEIRYEVDPSVIDIDPVMNKILSKPTIAFDVLINIYNNMKRQGKLQTKKKKKIGFFYSRHPYFKDLGGLN